MNHFAAYVLVKRGRCKSESCYSVLKIWMWNFKIHCNAFVICVPSSLCQHIYSQNIYDVKDFVSDCDFLCEKHVDGCSIANQRCSRMNVRPQIATQAITIPSNTDRFAPDLFHEVLSIFLNRKSESHEAPLKRHFSIYCFPVSKFVYNCQRN